MADAPTRAPIAPPADARPAPRPHGLRRRGRALWRHPLFREGAQDMRGMALGIFAWGLVTGVAMVNSGMGTLTALACSVLVFSGTAQLATAPMFASGAPIWMVWLTALCLNLRFVVYSTQWRPFLQPLRRRHRAWASYWAADWNYLYFMRRWPEPVAARGQLPYFWGGVVVNAGAWHLGSLLGIVASHQIPERWGLGFAGTVALLGMTWGLLAERRTWLPALLSGAAALLALGLPLRLHLLVAMTVAVAVGLAIDALPAGTRRAAEPPTAR